MELCALAIPALVFAVAALPSRATVVATLSTVAHASITLQLTDLESLVVRRVQRSPSDAPRAHAGILPKGAKRP